MTCGTYLPRFEVFQAVFVNARSQANFLIGLMSPALTAGDPGMTPSVVPRRLVEYLV